MRSSFSPALTRAQPVRKLPGEGACVTVFFLAVMVVSPLQFRILHCSISLTIGPVPRPVKMFLRACQSSLKMSPSLPRLKCPLFVFWFALFFFPCARFPFSSKNFAPGCPRNDDSYLGRPTASPVFARPVGLVRSAVLRSPKGGAFRTQRRARPTTAGLRRPPWTRASPSLGESPLATGDSLAAPTSFWPSAELADWPA